MLQQHQLSVGHNHHEVRAGKAFLEPRLRFSISISFTSFTFVLTAATAGPSKGHNCQNSQGGRFRQRAQPRPLYSVSTFFFF